MKILPAVKDGRHLQPFVCWLYGNNTEVFDTGDRPPYHLGQLWLVAEEIESTEYRNWLANELQRAPATIEQYMRAYNELCSVEQGESAIGNFMISGMAYVLVTKGLTDIFGGDKPSTLEHAIFAEGRKLWRRICPVLDGMNQEFRAGELQDPKDRYDCWLHQHDTEESRESCPRYRKAEVQSPAGTIIDITENDKGEDRAKKRACPDSFDPDNKRVTI